MKKLLLLSALLIFACGSDSSDSDDNDLMEETFLERYDGVVWGSTFSEDGVEYTSYLRFNNDDINWWTNTVYLGGGEFDSCQDIEDSELTYTLINNSGNFFSCSGVFPEGNGVIFNCTAYDGGNSLAFEYLLYSNFAELEGLQISTTTLTRSQDEFPCP